MASLIFRISGTKELYRLIETICLHGIRKSRVRMRVHTSNTFGKLWMFCLLELTAFFDEI